MAPKGVQIPTAADIANNLIFFFIITASSLVNERLPSLDAGQYQPAVYVTKRQDFRAAIVKRSCTMEGHRSGLVDLLP